MAILKGRFHAIDDVDLNGHHLRDWRYLSDIPQGGASTNNVLAWDGDAWTPATISGTAIATIYWDDVQDKPSTYPPDSHTHLWAEVTGKPSTYPPSSHTHTTTYTVNVVMSGGGSTLAATGAAGGFRLPTDSTLVSASIYADQSGTLSVEINGTSYAGYTASLTDLTGGNDLDLSGAVKVDNTTLTAWTTSFGAGDLFTYGITGTVNNITWAVVSLTFEKDIS